MLFAVAVVFIPLGAVCLGASNSVQEVRRRYDDEPSCRDGFFPTADEETRKLSEDGAGTRCELTLEVKQTMKAPVYVYYEMTNYLQNHRRFVKSRSDEQLAGKDPANTFCDPRLEVLNATTGEKSRVNPCGLMAWSLFNDTYAFEVDGVDVPVNSTDIAWKSDAKFKFAKYEPKNMNTAASTRGGGTIDGSVGTDEHFIVWMRTAALPKFRKLWGRIERDIPAGSTVRVGVDNRYNTYKFDGRKSLVLSTSSFLGGKNAFLGAAYLAVGLLCAGCSAVFLYFHFRPPRRIGDMSELSWAKTSGVDARVNAPY